MRRGTRGKCAKQLSCNLHPFLAASRQLTELYINLLFLNLAPPSPSYDRSAAEYFKSEEDCESACRSYSKESSPNDLL